jgi:hypothetical protein
VEEISSSSEEENNESMSPLNIMRWVQILDAVIRNMVKIANSLKTLVKKDPTIEKLNPISAKQVRNIKRWMEKYSKERTGTQQKATVATQISPR